MTFCTWISNRQDYSVESLKLTIFLNFLHNLLFFSFHSSEKTRKQGMQSLKNKQKPGSDKKMVMEDSDHHDETSDIDVETSIKELDVDMCTQQVNILVDSSFFTLFSYCVLLSTTF